MSKEHQELETESAGLTVISFKAFWSLMVDYNLTQVNTPLFLLVYIISSLFSLLPSLPFRFYAIPRVNTVLSLLYPLQYFY